MATRTSSSSRGRAQPRRLEPLRVLIASYRCAPHVGGQGVYVRNLAQALTELGCQVTVAAGPPYPDLPEGVALQKLPSLDLHAQPNGLTALRYEHWRSWADMAEWLSHNTGAFGEMYAFGLRLRAWLQREGAGRFDVLHDNQGLYRSLIDIAHDGLPVTATLHHPITVDRNLEMAAKHNPFAKLMLRRWYNFLEMQGETLRALPRIVAVSRAARRDGAYAFGFDPDKAVVSYNGVDHRIFSPGPWSSRRKTLIVTTASADTPVKGLSVLIGAFAILARGKPRLRMKVIGQLREGPTKQRLKRAELENKVEFLTGLSDHEVAQVFREAALVVSPSLYEGFGLPAAEAMACGAPVVASAAGGLPEVVGNAGVLVPPGDSSNLASAIDQLLDDPSRRERLSEAAVARAKLMFSWEQHAKDCLAVYHEVIADAHDRA